MSSETDLPPRPPVPLVGHGLRLRPVACGDASVLYAGWTSAPEAMRYLPWHPHTDLRETEEFVELAEHDWESRVKYRFMAFDDTAEPAAPAIGFGMLKFEEGCRAEVGFVVFPGHRGRGVATRIARVLSDWALAQPAIWRAYGICDFENVASARALERAGFAFESRWERWSVHPSFGPEPRAMDCYVRLREPHAVSPRPLSS